MTSPPLQVDVELPDADAIRARIDYLDEEAAPLRKLLRLTVRIEGRKPLTSTNPNAKQRAVADAAAR
jgi:hypothetical protein